MTNLLNFDTIHSKARANAVGRNSQVMAWVNVRVFTAFAHLTRQCWIIHEIMRRVSKAGTLDHIELIEALKCQVVGWLRSCYGSLFGLVLYGRCYCSALRPHLPLMVLLIGLAHKYSNYRKRSANTFWNSVSRTLRLGEHGVTEWRAV
jgi:hypothetical protein